MTWEKTPQSIGSAKITYPMWFNKPKIIQEVTWWNVIIPEVIDETKCKLDILSENTEINWDYWNIDLAEEWRNC